MIVRSQVHDVAEKEGLVDVVLARAVSVHRGPLQTADPVHWFRRRA